ncbi:hypothetical protein [Streptomyces sp. NBC_01262]|uniref:hypothetical protein n=1 Tax=Streptomyces sp. NBC_01262 TaxID=2903803 RepID=UPI002E37517F|nr:hypothetical protein [Streptomyces sp. NBC_01262]
MIELKKVIRVLDASPRKGLAVPTPAEVQKLAEALATANLINTNASAREHFRTLGDVKFDQEPCAPWYIVGGAHYVIFPSGGQCYPVPPMIVPPEGEPNPEPPA